MYVTYGCKVIYGIYIDLNIRFHHVSPHLQQQHYIYIYIFDKYITLYIHILLGKFAYIMQGTANPPRLITLSITK